MKTTQLIKKGGLLFVLTLFLMSSALAQISQGGEPYNWIDKREDNTLSYHTTGTLDYALLAAQDAINDQHKDLPYRFGEEHAVSLNTENSGRWTSLGDGSSIWQLGIHCPDATAISVLFDQYTLPKGAKVFIWTADRNEYIGSFDYRNNDPSGILATSLLGGDRVVVELIIPDAKRDQLKFSIGEIVHGYRSVLRSENSLYEGNRGPFGSSGSCNNNVNCPVGVDWQVEKRAVALIVEGGSAICTGALVNNTANDGTPYFLTAEHCMPNNNNTLNSWVFYFNHESATCNGTSGPTNQSISGATFRAKRSGSDFALIQLNSTPPSGYNVLYAGWDRSDLQNVTESVGIHHPSGDVKKISFDNDAPFQENAQGAQVWVIENWEDGVTEGGSSGSPLFNQHHRIIGQLYAGSSACIGNNENNGYDIYGRFGISWNTGTNSASRLREWLDPGNTGVLTLDSYPDGMVQYALDAKAAGISGIQAVVCGSTITPVLLLQNNGTQTLTSCTITYQLNSGTAQSINWTGSLASSQTTQVTLPAITTSVVDNTLVVTISNPNGSTDQNVNNNSITTNYSAIPGENNPVSFTLVFDEYPTETSWTVRNANNQIVYTSGGASYGNSYAGTTLNLEFCLPDGCYTFNILDSSNDGICCGYGQGSYILTDQSGTTLAAGGQFGGSQSTPFCLSVSSVAEEGALSVSIYPNPANDRITIQQKETIERVSIRDMSGRLVMSVNPYSTIAEIATDMLANGIYTCEVASAKSTSVQKLMIRH